MPSNLNADTLTLLRVIEDLHYGYGRSIVFEPTPEAVLNAEFYGTAIHLESLLRRAEELGLISREYTFMAKEGEYRNRSGRLISVKLQKMGDHTVYASFNNDEQVMTCKAYWESGIEGVPPQLRVRACRITAKGLEAIQNASTPGVDAAVGETENQSLVESLEPTISSESNESEYCYFKDGEKWVLRFKDESASFNNTIGIRHIHKLINASPGTLTPLELSRPTGIDENETAAIQSLGSDDAIDPEAESAIRREYNDLTSRIEEAERNNDEGVSGLRGERTKLTEQLARDKGINGRRRAAGEASPTEKARQSVKQAIARAIERIQVQMLHCGSHLRAHIETGVSCKYLPDSKISWNLQKQPL